MPQKLMTLQADEISDDEREAARIEQEYARAEQEAAHPAGYASWQTEASPRRRRLPIRRPSSTSRRSVLEAAE